jgi:hypothetical protein
MNTKPSLSMLVCACLLWSAAATAQPAASPTAGAEAVVPTAPRATHRGLLVLPNTSDVSSPGLSASFDASKTDKEGSVAVVFTNPDETLTFGLTATGEIAEGAEDTRPVDLRGLDADANVELSLNWFLWPGRPRPLLQEAYCLERTMKSECDDDDPAFTPEERQHYLELAYANRNPWTIGLSVEVGRTEFEYRRLSDLGAQSEGHNDWTIGASVGQYEPLRGYLKASYNYERSWSAGGKKREICTPLADSVANATECRSLVLAPPEQDELHLATIEWRKFFRGGHVAINPAFTRDLGEGVNQFTLPLYFFADEDGGLAGGIRGIWQKGAKPAIFIFIGTALTILD